MSEGDEVKVEGELKVTEANVTSECKTPRKVKVNRGHTTTGNKGQHVQARAVREQAAAGSVRQSWSEQVVESCLTVAPAMRHHIIGPKGTTITTIEAQCRGVRVSVPPPKDLKDHTVRVRGPARQVAAAMSCLEAVLQREQHVVASVRVEPHHRRHVIGPRGATLTTLHAHFPHVRVKVPRQQDHHTRNVCVHGSRGSVAQAVSCINDILYQAEAEAAKDKDKVRPPPSPPCHHHKHCGGG